MKTFVISNRVTINLTDFFNLYPPTKKLNKLVVGNNLKVHGPGSPPQLSPSRLTPMVNFIYKLLSTTSETKKREFGVKI